MQRGAMSPGTVMSIMKVVVELASLAVKAVGDAEKKPEARVDMLWQEAKSRIALDRARKLAKERFGQ